MTATQATVLPEANFGSLTGPGQSQPTEGHEATNFLVINYCFTYNTVSKSTKIGGPFQIEIGEG